jgi:uracil-DNA glycosylase
MTALRNAYLDALGIDRWTPRAAPSATAAPAPTPALAPAPEPRAARALQSLAAPVAAPRTPAARAPGTEAREPLPLEPLPPAADWDTLRARVAACTACDLCKTRTQTVFGVGNTRAEWLVVGEAPGADEDRKGEPFVGRAGQLLNAMLLAIGLPRETVFIANILKCRPPGNRDPKPEEVSRCLPFLTQQVALLAPRIILVVGRIAAQTLLATDAPLARLRGKLHAFGAADTPLVITYHPAYLLRSPADKRKAWEDLKFARATHARLAAGAPGRA